MPISKPDITLNIVPAQSILQTNGHRVLIVGQKLSGGTATAGEIASDVGNATSEINGLFGATSILAEMVREFKKYNKNTALDVLPLADNGSAVAATSEIAFTGTATASGTINVTFGSEKRYKAQISIASGDTAAQVATAVTNAFAAFTSAPFTVADATGTVTATAENGGTHANDWTTIVEGAVAGISAAITNWTGGATDPVLTGVLDVLGSVRYNTVVWPSVYAITDIETVLNDRFNTDNAILDGVAIQVRKGTLSSLKSYTSTINSQSVVVIGDKSVDESARKGTALKEILDVTAAQAAALRALRLTLNANLTQYLTATSSLDQFGGDSLASLPYFNTALPNLPVPLPADEFSFEDQTELNSNAVSLISANRAFNTAIMGEMVTTYLTDSAGDPDTSFKYLNTVDTASVIRETFFVNYKNKYAQTRLTEGDLIAGREMANVASIRAFSLEVYRSLATAGLVQAGTAAEADFLDNLIVTVNLQTGTATITMSPLLVTQLRAILGTIQINFGG